VRFWDIRSKAVAGEVKVGELPFTLAWTPDGTEIVVGRKVMAHVIDAHSSR
jgi:THO complex subunit 3